MILAQRTPLLQTRPQYQLAQLSVLSWLHSRKSPAWIHRSAHVWVNIRLLNGMQPTMWSHDTMQNGTNPELLPLIAQQLSSKASLGLSCYLVDAIRAAEGLLSGSVREALVSRLHRLEVLQQNDCWLNNVPDQISQLTRLTSLRLRHYGGRERFRLPHGFSTLTGLHRLSLMSGGKKLSWQPSLLQHLTYLNFGGGMPCKCLAPLHARQLIGCLGAYYVVAHMSCKHGSS